MYVGARIWKEMEDRGVTEDNVKAMPPGILSRTWNDIYNSCSASAKTFPLVSNLSIVVIGTLKCSGRKTPIILILQTSKRQQKSVKWLHQDWYATGFKKARTETTIDANDIKGNKNDVMEFELYSSGGIIKGMIDLYFARMESGNPRYWTCFWEQSFDLLQNQLETPLQFI